MRKCGVVTRRSNLLAQSDQVRMTVEYPVEYYPGGVCVETVMLKRKSTAGAESIRCTHFGKIFHSLPKRLTGTPSSVGVNSGIKAFGLDNSRNSSSS